MRPIWTGSLSFGLVNIPVKLYLAAKSERFSFRMLHQKDQGPIQFRRFCSVEEKEVPYEEIARGYEYEKGQYVLIEDEDFQRIERPSGHLVDIQQFVGAGEINPMYFDTPYYLEPTRGAERAYALLREALRRSGRVGIARVALREREVVAAVYPVDEALVLSTLRFAAEIREAQGLHVPEATTDLPEKQIDLAMTLVDQLAGPFEPQAYRDSEHEQMEEMIHKKLEGLPVPKRAPAGASTAQVVDLAEVLERSLRKVKKPERAEATGERRAQRAQAARRGRTGKRR